jgi:hypothetical protein
MLDEIIAEVRRAAEENLRDPFTATEKTAAFAVERLKRAPPDLLAPPAPGPTRGAHVPSGASMFCQ